eukprot:315242-Rhodomonas_salina.2
MATNQLVKQDFKSALESKGVMVIEAAGASRYRKALSARCVVVAHAQQHRLAPLPRTLRSE